MKKVRAAKSASDISLRKSATGAASSRSAFPTLKKKKTYSPPKKKSEKKTSTKTEKSLEPKSVKSERTNTTNPNTPVSSSTNTPVKSEKPKAIGAPPKAAPKTKKSSGPKAPREKTRTVFVAEPKVTLEEGPDFGKVTHDITKTKQPVNPRQFR